MTVAPEQLTAAITALGLDGRAVMVHAALRSFGTRVEADAVLDAFLARGCTVLVPTFTEPQFGVAPPPGLRPARNAFDYDAPSGPDTDAIYDVSCGVVNDGMGALPARLVRRAGARRGDHPLNSFAALGPRADDLARVQTPADVYAPIRALAGEDGAVLLIGVGLDRMTALHHAEERAGRRPLVRWARRPDGAIGTVETGSCSDGFPRLEPRLGPLARTATVGASRWRAFPVRAALDAAGAAMADDPEITRCAAPGCARCADSIAGGPTGMN
ncbi:Aminoglycoside 3-N-acetyltransferase [Actinomadura rubteroloni]|uniref:Aminoglycoside N(3)-acetyltransferase n=1 Tax=Actinomadura rubteroloni TaxID=1926885 RepID=A0A2P4UG57_9ACTN|nr:AAC(3) family N-acetyltransferase [Actinomadura rubteroloni]POM24009.1 Aminoglycoside 3-N-acetyltransferase [Actinomadura rubteroloni]